MIDRPGVLTRLRRPPNDLSDVPENKKDPPETREPKSTVFLIAYKLLRGLVG